MDEKNYKNGLERRVLKNSRADFEVAFFCQLFGTKEQGSVGYFVPNHVPGKCGYL